MNRGWINFLIKDQSTRWTSKFSIVAGPGRYWTHVFATIASRDGPSIDCQGWEKATRRIDDAHPVPCWMLWASMAAEKRQQFGCQSDFSTNFVWVFSINPAIHIEIHHRNRKSWPSLGPGSRGCDSRIMPTHIRWTGPALEKGTTSYLRFKDLLLAGRLAGGI